MPALTVHNAEIKTAAVEVRTLTISGKQVTLAVFRQLKRARWYSYEEPRGPGWGTVNYHPDGKDCSDDSDHLHVVWQLGDELRRAKVSRPYLTRERERIGIVYADDTESDVLRCPLFQRVANVEGNDYDVQATFPHQDVVLGSRLSGVAVRIEDRFRRWSKDHECSQHCESKLHQSLRSWCVKVLSDLGEVRQWDAACQLPQLFIAV